MKALVLLLLLSVMPVKAEQPDIQCPGLNTAEMRWCASQKWNESNQSVSTYPRCRGKLARMGLGGILGGLAGRYAVGGKRSNKTALGTTIGAFAGSLVGRATC